MCRSISKLALWHRDPSRRHFVLQFFLIKVFDKSTCWEAEASVMAEEFFPRTTRPDKKGAFSIPSESLVSGCFYMCFT